MLSWAIMETTVARWLVLVLLTSAVWGDQAALEKLNDEVVAASQKQDLAGVRQAATRLLAAAEAEGDDFYRGVGHLYLGELDFAAGDYAAALPHYQALLAVATRAKDAGDMAYAQLCLGLCHARLNQPERALECYGRSAEHYQAADDPAMASRARLAGADLHYRAGRLNDALTWARQAWDQAQRGEPAVERADIRYELGAIEVARGDPVRAEEEFRAGLEIATAAGDAERISSGHGHLGNLAAAAGDYAAADERFTTALKLAREAGQALLVSSHLRTLADVRKAQGRATEADALYREAIATASTPELREPRAVALSSYAVFLTERGEYPAAVAALNEARTIQAALRNPFAVAVVDSNLANIKQETGDLRGALAIHLASAETFEQAGLKEPLATIFNNIGRIYDVQGDRLSALEYYDRAVALCLELGLKPLAATALNNAGLVLFNSLRPVLLAAAPDSDEARAARAELAQAAAMFEQAVELLEQLGDRRILATVLNNLGQTYADLDRVDEAREQLDRALALHREMAQQPGLCQTTANLALLHHRAGDTVAAERLLRESLAISERIGDVVVRGMVLLNLAQIVHGAGRDEEAIAWLYQAVELIEQRRAMLGGGERQQRRFLEDNIQAYLLLIEALLATGRPEDAFAVAERSRGRALLDMLDSGHLDWTQRLPPDSAAGLHGREQAVSAANLTLNRLAARPGVTEAALGAARLALETARGALRDEENRLAGRYPDLAAESGRRPLDLQQAAAALPDDTALLEYAFGSSEAFVFTVWREGQTPRLRAGHVDSGDLPLAERVTDFRRACANPRRRYKAQAADLYRRLVAPALAELPEHIRRLVVVPDRELYDCPFQALWDESSESFLSDRYELVYAVSASLLAATLRLGAARRGEPPARGMLVVADPEFAAAAPRPADAPPAVRGFDLARLPGTREEARRIAEIMPEVNVLAGAEAQETRVKESLPAYRYLHFATHGLLDPDEPLYSSIALAEPREPGEDGFIEAREVARESLHAELVTLSACQTGRGKTECGEGLIGLPWAFFVARVPTQIVSLWSVDDFMTQELMTRFYRRLAAGECKAAALRAAAAELRAAELEGPDGRRVNPTHPYFWAPFVVLGDWR